MTIIDLPPSPLLITVIFLIVYAISLVKLVTRTFSDLRVWLTGHGTKNEQQLIKSITSSAALSSQSSTLTIEKESRFSTDWWCHDHIFQLERRAIFSKSWIYAAHRSCFSKPGDYITLTIAGFSFFLILGKDHVLRAFHNICRHRAYEVTRKLRGSSTILGCRYHGWCYDTKGQLTKAPEFETVPGFEKEKNGLWEIHLNITAQGLVFVNLDAAKSVSVLKSEELDTEAKDWDMVGSERVAEWRYEGEFNWKLAVISSSSGSGTERMFKDIPNNSRWISRFFNNIFKQKQQIHMRINLVTTISLYPTQESWLIVKIMPQSAMKTTLEYELYAQASQESPSVGASVNKLKETTFAETKRLQLLQKQFIEGTLFPDGVQIDQQNAVHALLIEHWKLERSKGMEIQPAARQISLSGRGQKDVNLCKALEKDSVKAGVGPSIFSVSEHLDW